MKSIPITLLTLFTLIVILLLVRSRWHSFAPRTRTSLLASALVAIGVFVFGRREAWVTSSDQLNCGFYWAAIAGYLLLLAIHSLNRPRWLTSASAVILAAPILTSSIFLPLTGIFHSTPRRVVPLGNNLYVSWQAFTELGPSSSGVDVDIFYRPPILPFLQHSRLGGRFYNRRCEAAATEVALQPDHDSVWVRCPPLPGSGESDPGEFLRLH